MLKARYGFGFERITVALAEGRLLLRRAHPTGALSASGATVVDIEGYAWVVPFVQTERGTFLKTMFPSRKATRMLLGERK